MRDDTRKPVGDRPKVISRVKQIKYRTNKNLEEINKLDDKESLFYEDDKNV